MEPRSFMAGFFFGAILIAVGLGIVGRVVITKVENAFRRNAIEHNAADYVCDPATGATEFRWKENK